MNYYKDVYNIIPFVNVVRVQVSTNKAITVFLKDETTVCFDGGQSQSFLDEYYKYLAEN